MFLRLNKATDIEIKWNTWWKSIKFKVLELSEKQFITEDVYGKSKIQYKIYQYYLAFYLVLLVYLEYKSGYNTNWNYYIKKYKLETKKHNLACNGVNLNILLSVFGLPRVFTNGGIEDMVIETSFEVEPTIWNPTGVSKTVDIKYELQNINNCYLYI